MDIAAESEPLYSLDVDLWVEELLLFVGLGTFDL